MTQGQNFWTPSIDLSHYKHDGLCVDYYSTTRWLIYTYLLSEAGCCYDVNHCLVIKYRILSGAHSENQTHYLLSLANYTKIQVRVTLGWSNSCRKRKFCEIIFKHYFTERWLIFIYLFIFLYDRRVMIYNTSLPTIALQRNSLQESIIHSVYTSSEKW